MGKKLETRTAIARHSTATSDDPWDGPEQESKLPTGRNRDFYARAYAFEDPDGDPTVKSSYRFIHHFVDDSGEPGDASTRAAVTGIAVLNGARGGTTIPADDRRGVWEHLAQHLRDAGLEPPPLRSQEGRSLERRELPVGELRVDFGVDGEDEKPPVIRGHAAIFNSLSVPIMGFRETIRPGAFAKTIKESDIRALWNHDDNYVLGRSKANTLRLSEDDRGLAVEIDPPKTQWATDLQESIKRGDVSQMSFGFTTIKDNWTVDDGEMRRELIEVRLFDVSPVTFPAYEATDVSVRGIAALIGLDVNAVEVAFRNAKTGNLNPTDVAVLKEIRAYVDACVNDEPPPAGHSASADPDQEVQSKHAHRRRRLDLLSHEGETA